jgi:hypothetical protein
MFERLLIATALVGLGLSAYTILKNWHLRRASRAAAGNGRPSILYFRSDHCAPYVTQARFLQELQADFGGRVAIEKIDVELESQRRMPAHWPASCRAWRA